MSESEKDEAANAARWDAAEEGAERLRDGDVEGAVRELTRLVSEEPNNEYGFYYLGAAHFEAGAFEKALKAYLSAIDAAPRYVGAMIGAGHALRMLGHHDKAIRMGKQVLLAQKDDADAFYLLGLCHYARGEQAAAKEALERFLETNPEFEAAQEARGLLEILVGNVQPLEE